MNCFVKAALFVFFTCFYIQVAMAHDGLLVFDQRVSPEFHLRKMEDLKIAGSVQFSEENLSTAAKAMQNNVWVIDLRRESHGYVGGLPISWYFPHNQSNLGLSTELILAQEAHQIASLKTQDPLIIHRITRKSGGKIVQTLPVTIVPHGLETEQQLCQRLGLNYLRLPVADHSRPNNKEVEQFVDFVKGQPKGTWLYFHCRGGKGRTTTFMVLYDMLMRAKSDSLEEIMARQKALGALDLFKTNADPEDAWKKDLQIERRNFIKSFYEYAASKEGYPQKTWHQWLEISKA